MSATSTKLENLILLKAIPESVICRAEVLHSDIRRARVWSTAFSVAASLKVSSSPFSTVSLILKYTDRCGEHAVFIDSTKNTKDRVILSGVARLNIVSEILKIDIYAFVPCNKILVSLEQVHINPVRSASFNQASA